MKLGKQKELAARTFKASKYKVKFNIKTDEDKKKVKEALSRADMLDLESQKIIKVQSIKGVSKTRRVYLKEQKKKGRRSGQGKRSGTANARFNKKEKWMIKIRALRKLLKTLKENGVFDTKTYRDLYKKAKGNLFRNKRHLLIYLKQHNLVSGKINLNVENKNKKVKKKEAEKKTKKLEDKKVKEAKK